MWCGMWCGTWYGMWCGMVLRRGTMVRYVVRCLTTVRWCGTWAWWFWFGFEVRYPVVRYTVVRYGGVVDWK
jgi:hypothetical protein